MSINSAISARLQETRETIAALENSFERKPASVQLLAVSKKKPASLIRDVAAAGQISFGENYADEGVDKINELTDLHLTWHFIGHIQSNKTRLIAEHFDWVQSIDREKTIERLAAHRPPDMAPLNICIQVNIDGQTSKSGCPPDDLDTLAKMVSGHNNLKLRGIMAIPAPQESHEQQRRVFASLFSVYKKLHTSYEHVDTLSMGMSGDMEAAIAEGATMVRIGTAIFGKREQ